MLVENGSLVDRSVERDAGRVMASPNRLKLGVFSANISGGTGAVTMLDGPPKIANWAEVKRIARAADRAGFEALVPVARWKGYLAPSGFWDRCLETFTWGAGLAEATQRIQIFTTCHVPMFHPVMAAKMGATLDFIAEWRWGLNVVAGWMGSEVEMFGRTLLPHADRYRYAEEWIQAVKRLWTEDKEFDLDTEFFQMRAAISTPKPVQRPLPAIMNAGLSPSGQQFAVRHADMIYINLGVAEGTEETIAGLNAAAAEAGRKVSIWGNVHIVCRPSEAEARDFVAYYADEHGDREGARRWAASMLSTDASTKDVWEADPDLLRSLMQNCGNLPIIGDPEQVVEKLSELSKLGLSGVNISWFDYDEGLQQYVDVLHPLMREAGLREDEPPLSYE
jgi:alkanesulfonate monooxygenase SsuD/methylene tetrahydromethanopterin reductase-like flavin-dependent oxidoreductase (luciferase family)